MTQQLAGKSAIITGAATGIGKASAKLFAREGANVVVADVDAAGGQQVAREIQAEGQTAIYVSVDVTDPAQVQNLMDQTLARFGRIDVLFNNAAVNLFARATETLVQEWDRVMSVNVKGVFLGCKYVIPIMQRQGGGSIVNSSSAAGIVGLRNLAAYTASKGAVLQLTKNLALDYAQDRIRVNALCPGVTATEMTVKMIATSNDPEGEKRRLSSGNPLGRMAEPDEIARAALFLASEASSFMTGAFLLADGGYCTG
ncbi:MAG: glucose 1-dehydrogenase [Chloroflexi bacterium]|nr:glucose 1-dehydrogenase [Chloroflexota bacterium]